MRAFHVQSWSEQAREFYDNIEHNVNCGGWSIDHAIYFIHNSYRAPIIRGRAAKKFGRRLRAGRIAESPKAVAEWQEEMWLHGQYYPNEARRFFY